MDNKANLGLNTIAPKVDENPPPEPANPIKSVQNAIEIMDILIDHDGPISIGELADNVDLSKGALSNHLSTLRSEGWVVKVDSNKFMVGLAGINICSNTVQSREIYQTGHKEVDKLANQFDSLFYLLAYEQGIGYCIHSNSSTDVLPAEKFKRGTRRYIHCNGGGLAVLAHVERERRNEILDYYGTPTCSLNCNFDCPLSTYEQEHPTTPDNILDRIEKIREQGYARTDHGELVCLGVPIFSTKNQVLGSIGTLGPKRQLINGRGAVESDLLEAIKNSASKITIHLH